MAPSISMIQLIGPGGSGKSTVGAALATRLGCPFHDLDREFERRAEIDSFIDRHGYEAYVRENVAVYLELLPHLPGSVVALSSGFMVYPTSVHRAYAAVAEAIVRSPTTVVLLASLDRETCVAETVRRQLGRPFGRGASREEAVIRERFDRYSALPTLKVETMRPAWDVAAAIHARLAADAPEALPATWRTRAAVGRAIRRYLQQTGGLRIASPSARLSFHPPAAEAGGSRTPDPRWTFKSPR